MQPLAAPSMVGCPFTSHSAPTHDKVAAAAAACVTTNAPAARPLAPSALPALKPNQPNHKSAAPSTVIGKWCGSMGTTPLPLRLPSIMQATKPLTPLKIWITVPPAKSSAPKSRSQPPTPHTQCAMGSYKNVVHKKVNSTNAPNLKRSA